MAQKYSQAQAILLNDGSKQLLPVSRDALIQLAYVDGRFGEGSMTVADALSYLLGKGTADLEAAKTYTADRLAALDLTTVSEAGKPIVSVGQEDGQVSAAAGTISSAYVTYNGDSVEAALADIYAQMGDGGSVAQQIEDAIDALDAEAMSEAGKPIVSISQTDGVVSATAGTIDAAYVTVDTTVWGAENDTVPEVLSYLQGQIDTLTTDSEVTLERFATDSSYAARYELSQGGASLGYIDIPKDMVATSGSLVHGSWDGSTFTPDPDGDAYIEMIIANSDPFYIDVKDLVEDKEFDDTTEIDFSKDATTGHIYAYVGEVAATKITYAGGTTVQAELEALNAKMGTDSVASQITSAVEALDSEIVAKVENDITYVMTGVTEADGVLTAATYTALLDSNIATTYVAGSELATLAGDEDVSDVQKVLEIIAGKVNSIEGGDAAVTSVTGATYTHDSAYIGIGPAAATKGAVALTLEHNLGNVATLHFDDLGSTDVVSIFGANPEV